VSCTETQTVAVAVVYVEVAAAVGLVANLARDLHTLRLKLGIERVGVVDPDVTFVFPTVSRSASSTTRTRAASR